MSGECEKCGEHGLECVCIMKRKYFKTTKLYKLSPLPQYAVGAVSILIFQILYKCVKHMYLEM